MDRPFWIRFSMLVCVATIQLFLGCKHTARREIRPIESLSNPGQPTVFEPKELGNGDNFKDWYNLHSAGDNSGAPYWGETDSSKGKTSLTAPILPSPKPVAAVPTTLPNVCSGHFERLESLLCAKVPMPNATDIIDQQAAIRLGKALFWDVQLGSDGQTACASCHYFSGEDNRVKNTLHPGPDGVFNSGGVTAEGGTFLATDITNDDRVGSQGVVGSIFSGLSADPKVAKDNCTADLTEPFFNERRVTGRNTPSVIGAVYYRHNFWDGRANDAFNGYDPFGQTANAGYPQKLFTNGSLASQAVGPPGNMTEMSCANRKFNGPDSIGAKLLVRQALKFQVVANTDSVLGDFSGFPGPGINCYGGPCTYQSMVEDAFGSAWVPFARDHFSRLFGQALQAYMSTLIPDQTRYDQWLAGKSRLFDTNLKKGFEIFRGVGACSKCHAGPELSDATVNYINHDGNSETQGNDEGYHNLGLRPTAEDMGRAGTGPSGASFSESGSSYDRGAFKTPGLRNVKLRAPFFHTGGKATLASVVDFYGHNGGDFPNPELSEELREIRLTTADKPYLVAFMRDGLTDCRVEKQRAPFDHPALTIPNGPILPAVGMAGLGSCLLDPAVPPTTKNCLLKSFACQNAAALHGTSVFLDLLGRLPNDTTEIASFLKADKAATIMAIKALLTNREYFEREGRRYLPIILRRKPNPASDSAYLSVAPAESIALMGSSNEYYLKSGNTRNLFVPKAVFDIARRTATNAEIQSISTNLARKKITLKDLILGYWKETSARTARCNELYRLYLRRQPTAKEKNDFLIADEATAIANLLTSDEYKVFAANRDDI